MANDDFAFGLRPVTQPYGQVRLTPYRLATSATLDVFIGEPMTLNSDGRVAAYTTGGDLAVCIGSVQGILAKEKGGLPTGMTSLSQGGYLPKNTDAVLMIADDPTQLFTIQAATDNTISETSIGNTARMTVRTTRGNSDSGVSYFELLSADCAADTGGTLQIVGLDNHVNSDGSENAVSLNYCKAVVRIYHHQLLGNSTSTAV